MNRRPAVAVIGAGVAGTSASALFRQAGWHVTLIDKAAKPGGRCATRRVSPSADSAWFDYGAQYFTVRDPAFQTIVEADLADGYLARWSPTIAVAENSDDTWTLTPSPDTRERLIGPTGLNHWARHRLAQSGVAPICNTRATGLRHRDGQWHLDCIDRSGGAAVYSADAVLITIPPVQARALLGEYAASFDVLARPDKALDACHAWVVEAPALDCQGIFVKDGHLAWCADNSHKAGDTRGSRRLWTLHASPAFSEAHVESTPAAIRQRLIDEFAAISDIPAHDIHPVHGHRWRYARPGAHPPSASTGCAITETRVALAGDWLSGGRVEGAWQSGRQAASALIDS